MSNFLKNLSVIILAAGKGKRMKSETPKVLHNICFKPIIYYILTAVTALNPKNVFVVVGHRGQLVEQYLKDNFPSFKVVNQEKQLGTAHAVKTTGVFIGEFSDNCLVLPGDIPLITIKSLKKAAISKIRSGDAATLVTSLVENPAGYGRIIRDSSGRIAKIVEESDATLDEKKIKEINTSIYCFSTLLLFKYFDKISSDNSQKEFYLTDIVECLVRDGYKVTGIPIEDCLEVEGINNREQLADLEKLMFKKINSKFMHQGVTLRNPETSYIDPDVKIGIDTIIEPNSIIRGKTRIGKNCLIGPFTQIEDSLIGNGTIIDKSVVQGANLGNFNNIGPNSYIRQGTITGENVKIGACCEIKKSTIRSNSKVPHLSYIGDADIGEDVNVGAATVTCNYDGFLKSCTVIEDGVFIGSDTMLVAPIRIGRNSITAAGSVISQDVPPDGLAIERNRQTNIEEGAKRFRERKQKEKEKTGKKMVKNEKSGNKKERK